MTDDQLITYWLIGLLVAVVIVAVAAALLLSVLAAARRIEHGAGVALGQVRQVRAQTQVIWALQDTNAVAAQLLAGAQAILGHAGQIAHALHEADIRRGRA